MISIVIIPILFQYSAGIATITVGDIFLLISTGALIIFNIKNIKINYNLLILFIFILFVTLIGIVNSDTGSLNLNTTIRYLFYLFSIIFASSIVDYKFAIRVYKVTAIASAIFLIFQIIFLNVFGIFISGVIPGLPLTDSSLNSYVDVINAAQVKRCMAFFAEPSHFAIYVLGFITVYMFNNLTINKNSIVTLIILSLSVVLSTSITGMLVLAVLWIKFIIGQLHNYKVNYMKIIGIVCVLILFLCFIFQTDGVKYLFNKDVFERQSSGRFGGFEYLNVYLDKVEIGTQLLGIGMHDNLSTEIYLSGYPRAIYYFGFVGIFVYFIVFAKLWRKTGEVGKMLIVVIAILSMGTEMLFSDFLLPYLLFIISLKKEKKEKMYEKNYASFWDKTRSNKNVPIG